MQILIKKATNKKVRGYRRNTLLLLIFAVTQFANLNEEPDFARLKLRGFAECLRLKVI